MYTPVPTNAQMINPMTGALQPITSPTALILFSSAADVAEYAPLILALDPQAQAFDGNGIVCPPVLYGSDGRKINCFQGTVIINGQTLAWQTAVGILIAQKSWGPMWNGMRQPGPGGVYNALFLDSLNDGADAQLNWGYKSA